MAKAAAQARGAKASQRAGGRKAPAAGKPRARAPRPWVKVLALIILFPFAAVLLPTTLVFFVMMAPTWVAYITDRSREKHLAVTVGMLNFAGTLPAIIDLWSRGQSHETAMLLIGDVFVWAQAYGAAFAGWAVFATMPTIVGSFYRMTTESRMKGLVKQQKALIAEWGHAVADGIVPAMPGEEESGPESSGPESSGREDEESAAADDDGEAEQAARR